MYYHLKIQTKFDKILSKEKIMKLSDFNFSDYIDAIQKEPEIINYGNAYLRHDKCRDCKGSSEYYSVFGEEIAEAKFDTEEQAKEYLLSHGYQYMLDGAMYRWINLEKHAHYEQNETLRKAIHNGRDRASKNFLDFLEQNYKKVFVRYGAVPESGRSYNFRDNYQEAGVSVYQAFETEAGYIIIPTGFTLFNFLDSDTPCYLVSGKELSEHGGDDEVLLSECKIIRPIKKVYELHAFLFNQIKKEQKN